MKKPKRDIGPEILRLKSEGMCNKDIAAQLRCSNAAVSYHFSAGSPKHRNLKQCVDCGVDMPSRRLYGQCHDCKLKSEDILPTRVCKSCSVRKFKIEFPSHKQVVHMPDGSDRYVYNRRSSCYECTNKKMTEKKAKLPPEHVKFARAKRKFSKYGLTIDSANDLLESQGGKCKICSLEISFSSEKCKNKACIDHCHKTGKIRGLLCNNCNSGIGYLQDSPEILEIAINYLGSFMEAEDSP